MLLWLGLISINLALLSTIPVNIYFWLFKSTQ